MDDFELRPGHPPELTGGPGEPWLVKAAIPFLNQHLDGRWRGLEWGGGSSAPWYLNRLSSLITIEHDRDWYDRLRSHLFGAKRFEILKRDDPASWQLLWLPATETGDVHYRGSNGRFYKQYVCSAALHGTYQFIAIDGRARCACLALAASLLYTPKRLGGGLVVLDNSERDEYQEAIRDCIPPEWQRHDFHNGEWQTTAWRVPPGWQKEA